MNLPMLSAYTSEIRTVGSRTNTCESASAAHLKPLKQEWGILCFLLTREKKSIFNDRIQSLQSTRYVYVYDYFEFTSNEENAKRNKYRKK